MLIIVSAALVGIQQGFTINGFSGQIATAVFMAAAIVLLVLVFLVFIALALDHEARERDVYGKAGRAAKKAGKKAAESGKGLFARLRHRDED